MQIKSSKITLKTEIQPRFIHNNFAGHFSPYNDKIPAQLQNFCTYTKEKCTRVHRSSSGISLTQINESVAAGADFAASNVPDGEAVELGGDAVEFRQPVSRRSQTRRTLQVQAQTAHFPQVLIEVLKYKKNASSTGSNRTFHRF